MLTILRCQGEEGNEHKWKTAGTNRKRIITQGNMA